MPATKFKIVLPVLSNYISYFSHYCEKSSIRKEKFNLAHSLRGYSSLWQWSHGNREMGRLIILFPKSGIVRGNMVCVWGGDTWAQLSCLFPFSLLFSLGTEKMRWSHPHSGPVHPLFKHPQRHTKRYLSQMMIQRIKLIINFTHTMICWFICHLLG